MRFGRLAVRFVGGGGTLALVLFAFGSTARPAGAQNPPTKPEHVVSGPAHHIVYPSDQMAPRTARRAATTASAAAAIAPFLTRPYWGLHSVTSIFDHCNPDYSHDGKICDGDGGVAYSSNGVDPTFSSGYAYTRGGTDYVYYDGHNGWDLALNYETLLAAAAGTVNLAGSDPYNPGFGQTVTIDHGNGFTTRYAHMSQIWVSPGQHVDRGQGIGVSGNTGTSSGPHLHFGLYITNPWTAIDPWGWNGAGPDPWPADSGDLWITGNPRDPIPDAPVNVAASSVGQTATITWSPPSFDGGSGISSYVVSASPGGASVTVSGASTTASLSGLAYGSTYTFTVVARNGVGSSPTSAASNPVTITAAYDQWFPWYDNASAGMTSDNIHLLNPGTTSVSGAVTVAGAASVPISLSPGAATYVAMPAGTMGGPVRVTTSASIVVSKRTAFGESLTEMAGIPTSRMSTSLMFNWFDNLSPGMASDNIHLGNPGSTPVTGRVSLPGVADVAFSIDSGKATYVTFPAGTRGGPVTVTASGAIFATQRTIYRSSLVEVPAMVPGDAANDLYMNWYDLRSPGMLSDNIHLLNPAGSPAQGTITLAAGQPISFNIPAGGSSYFTYPSGTIGGPVHVHSSVPILVTQRVAYGDSLSELPGRSSSVATTKQSFTWFDNSSSGMLSDNVHLLNVGTSTANGKVSLPGVAPIVFSVPPGQETYLTLSPPAIGGPLTVTSDNPVMASQRVAYLGSLTETWSQPTS